MTKRLSRRRAILIAGATAGMALSPGLLRASSGPGLRRWRGTALGADATILLHHADRSVANRLIGRCVAEIERLERIFSLYRRDSAVALLNREGALDDPPLDLVRLLAESRGFWSLTGGAFDPTVQPLWDLYARHFARPDADPAGPDPQEIAGARSRIGFDRVDFDAGRVSFSTPGMAVTFNGIAQGYITDRVADLLRGQGIERVLLELGEVRALGRHPGGRPWQVGLADPGDPRRTTRTIEIEDGAVATSGGYGTRFDADGRHHHLFDPATGLSANRYRSVSVEAPLATTADALSTGFSAMPLGDARAVVAATGRIEALFMLAGGSTRVFGRRQG
jgi:thiamine biosynthesis lipoprotein